MYQLSGFVGALWFTVFIFGSLAHEHSNAEGVDGMYMHFLLGV